LGQPPGYEVAQAKGIGAAVRYGQQRRTEVVSAIVAAQHSMSDSSQKLHQAVIDLVARAQQRWEQPPTPALPEAVVAQARHRRGARRDPAGPEIVRSPAGHPDPAASRPGQR
jgi:hypothetical protein